GLLKEKHTMKRTEILLTLLASTTLVLVVACGGKQEASPTLPERALPSSQPAVSPAPPPQVVTRTVVVTQPPPLPLQETLSLARCCLCGCRDTGPGIMAGSGSLDTGTSLPSV